MIRDVLAPNLKMVFTHVFGSFEVLLDEGGYRNLAIVILSVVVFWHIYTPVHELMHVGACLLGGGTVEELALKPQYGGAVLQHVFPFVTPESDYAGQLTGFTTPNDLVYMFVDFAPYLISVFGLSLIQLARTKHRPEAFGVGVVLGFVPVMSIPGDYYEGVSLVTSRLADWMGSGLGVRGLVSDDIFKLAGELQSGGGLNAVSVLFFGVGVVLAVYLVVVTIGLQVVVAKRIFGPSVFETAKGSDPVTDS